MMEAVDFLQIMLYILGSILLVVLIILGIKTTVTMNKIEMLVDNINGKVNKLNGVFNIIDITTDKIALLSDKFVDRVGALVSKVIYKKKKEDGKNE